MILEKRYYQENAIESGINFLQGNADRNEIIVMPTGGGKSNVIARISSELSGNSVIFQPSKEILEQNYAKLLNYGFKAGIYSASKNRREIQKITFATIGSVSGREELFQSFQNIIVDECHLVNSKGGMYSDFFDKVDAKVLGLTATPFRLTSDGYGGSMLKFITRTRPRVFSKINHLTQTGELFEGGYLSKMEYFSVDGFDRNAISVNTTGADYDQRSLQHYFNKSGFIERTARATNKLLKIGRRGVLVFTRYIHEAEAISRLVAGSVVITGDTKTRERARILAEFKAGIIKCVINCGVLVVGFDYPELDTVVVAKPTLSLAQWYQILGRAVRFHPDKESGWIVDMCGNLPIFGRMEDLVLETVDGKWAVTSKGRQLTNTYFG